MRLCEGESPSVISTMDIRIMGDTPIRGRDCVSYQQFRRIQITCCIFDVIEQVLGYTVTQELCGQVPYHNALSISVPIPKLYAHLLILGDY